jgi:hypothetical protein
MKKWLAYFNLIGLALIFTFSGTGCKSQKVVQEAQASRPATPSECLPKELDGFQLESIVQEADFAQALFSQPSTQVYLAIIVSQAAQANQVLPEMETQFNEWTEKDFASNSAWEGYAQDGFSHQFYFGFINDPFFYEIRLRSPLKGQLDKEDLRELSKEVVSQLEL